MIIMFNNCNNSNNSNSNNNTSFTLVARVQLSKNKQYVFSDSGTM